MSPPLSDLNGLVHMQTLEGDSLHVSELGHQLLVTGELLVEPAYGHNDDDYDVGAFSVIVKSSQKVRLKLY